MTQDQLPEHLLLAVAANRLTGLHATISKFDCTRIAEEIANLRAGYAAARLEIESLHAQLEAIGAGGVEPLRKTAQAVPDVSGYIAEWRGGICTAEEAMQGIAKLYAAPQPAVAAEGDALDAERRMAIKEGHRNAASDDWFKARYEGLDTNDRRNVFSAGFDRGWDAALAAQREVKP